MLNKYDIIEIRFKVGEVDNVLTLKGINTYIESLDNLKKDFEKLNKIKDKETR